MAAKSVDVEMFYELVKYTLRGVQCPALLEGALRYGAICDTVAQANARLGPHVRDES